MTLDQVFVPRTRSQRGLPPLNPDREDALGSSISNEVLRELRDALGDSPIGAAVPVCGYLVRPRLRLRDGSELNSASACRLGHVSDPQCVRSEALPTRHQPFVD